MRSSSTAGIYKGVYSTQVDVDKGEVRTLR